LGWYTYNTVFGTTGIAFDPSISAGGSTGLAAVSMDTRRRWMDGCGDWRYLAGVAYLSTCRPDLALAAY